MQRDMHGNYFFFKKTEVIPKLWTVLVNVNHQLDEIQNHLGVDLLA